MLGMSVLQQKRAHCSKGCDQYTLVLSISTLHSKHTTTNATIISASAAGARLGKLPGLSVRETKFPDAGGLATSLPCIMRHNIYVQKAACAVYTQACVSQHKLPQPLQVHLTILFTQDQVGYNDPRHYANSLRSTCIRLQVAKT